MKLRPRKDTPGRPKTGIPTPSDLSRYSRRNPRIMTTPTAAEILILIDNAIIAHEASLTAAGRLIPAAGLPRALPTPVLCQYVTDPYKGDFNPADKGGSILFNKATEALKDSDKFTFNQEKAYNLLAEMKTQSEKFKWENTSTVFK